jgi:acetoin utilization deacetylase AcuC-like enzyme
VAVVDWDLHHGNGTQKAFYKTKRVLYISLHQYPYYPGTGAANEVGAGDGLGYTVNVPLKSGSTDEDYRRAFNEIILPRLREFAPELLFISAGFDAHRADPLGGMRLSTEFFGEMTRMMAEIADEFCGGRIISVLEGGYDFTALRESIELHLKELHR